MNRGHYKKDLIETGNRVINYCCSALFPWFGHRRASTIKLTGLSVGVMTSRMEGSSSRQAVRKLIFCRICGDDSFLITLTRFFIFVSLRWLYKQHQNRKVNSRFVSFDFTKETFRFYDQDDHEYEIFSALSSAS